MNFVCRTIILSAVSLCALHGVYASVATYRLTVVNTWNPTDYPVNYPTNGHFSNLGGGTHESHQSYWDAGELSSSQIEVMAEAGNVNPLANLIIDEGGSALVWSQWFCREGFSHPSCGSLVHEFTVDSERPAITITSMLAPSPDWFIGVSGLNLLENGQWRPFVEVPLALWDAGTEEGSTPTTSNPPTLPAQSIQLYTYNSITGFYNATTTPDIIGSFTFQLLSVEGFDTDTDGIEDESDNCIEVANADQQDTDNDGFGNACDADTNNDCVINFLDVSNFSSAFLTNDPLYDFNGDGTVNFVDFVLVGESFLSPPGPSGISVCAFE